jgi:hypothetical protein
VTGSDPHVHPDGCTAVPAHIDGWKLASAERNMPQAMWKPSPAGGQPDLNPDSSTLPATLGMTMSPAPRVLTNGTPEMVIDQVFQDRSVYQPQDEYGLPLSQRQSPAANVPVEGNTFADLVGIASLPARDALFAALGEMGINGWTNDPLDRMAKDPGREFADEPLEGTPVPA